MLDFQTGNQLAIAGAIPYVVSAGAVTSAALALLEDAGLPVDADLRTYFSIGDYRELLRRLSDEGLRYATQRPHSEEEVPPEAALVNLEVQRALNDKGRMEEIVPAEWLPRRRRAATADLERAAARFDGGGPIVIKAATPLPSGGGYAVWICRSPEDLAAARAALGREPHIVVEEFLAIRRSVCVHVVVDTDGAASVVGFAEEICREDGRWLGNWLDAESDDVPEEVARVVLEIGHAAAARGYRGIAGIDVAFLEDGPPRVLDLNFRVNGSTAAVWLREGIERHRGAGSMRLKSWACEAGFDRLLAVARREMENGALIPLCLYDPSASESGGLARLQGILHGPTRDAVREIEARFADLGLV